MRKAPKDFSSGALTVKQGDGSLGLLQRDGRDPIWILRRSQSFSSAVSSRVQVPVDWMPSRVPVRVECSEDVKESDGRNARAGSVSHGASDPMFHGV